MRIVKIIALFCLLTTLHAANGQVRLQPKKIKVKEDYVHTPTHTLFPNVLFDEYQRQSIYSFDKKNENVGVTYEKKQNGMRTTFSLYLFPAGDAFEGRLRKGYLESIEPIVKLTKNGLHIMQYAVQHKGEKYVCNGFKCTFKTDIGEQSQLTIFESGTWFYKLRVTTNQLDTSQISKLEEKVLQKFDPTQLVDLNRLNEKVGFYFSRTFFNDSASIDSALLGSAMSSGFKKIEWIMENIDENERATGFPDLYLDLHVEALKVFIGFRHRIKTTASEHTVRYLNELQAISDAGFLPEFVMEQYDMMLIIPKDTPARYDEYLAWKSENNITVKLNKNFYILRLSAVK